MSDQQRASGTTGAGPREGSPPRPAVGAPEGAAQALAEGAGRSRPSVMSLAIRERAALYAAYMRFVEGGGLFIPTTRPARIGDEIYAILTLLDEPGKVALPGRVCWITPAGVPGRPQGIGIQFARNDAGEAARVRIETLLSGEIATNRPTHTI
ncbi:MAG: type fimbriae assembly protein [Pseudomonadota bacterium]|jgi:type IV pilus assembly protein PilZ